MADEERGKAPEDQGGVFGSLPGTRPAVRSPRRSGDAEPRASQGSHEPPPEAPEPEVPADKETEGGNVEELAWTGITVAAEAATLGVRLVSRAMEAVRKPADRR